MPVKEQIARSRSPRRELLAKARLQQSLDDSTQPDAAQKSQPVDPTCAINVGVSSRALFSIDGDITSYDDEGQLRSYVDSQLRHETEPFQPGSAFPFIQALETVNSCLRKINPAEQELFNVVLISHNHAQLGVRLINSINYHNLSIERMCLTGGGSPVPDYLAAYNISLFLTSFPEEVALALKHGFAAAALSRQKIEEPIKNELRVAFGLDAVLFAKNDHCEENCGGLGQLLQQSCAEYEQAMADMPLEEGPLKQFAAALGRMQTKLWRGRAIVPTSPLRIYIVTSRGALNAGERAIKTLRAWGLEVDEIHFLAGADKGPVLRAIKPHLFFDDRHVHIRSATELGLPGAHVPPHAVIGRVHDRDLVAFSCRSPATSRGQSPVDDSAGDSYQG